MFLLDTSIWIDYFKGSLDNLLKQQILIYIENDEIYYNGIILAELLIGTKNKKEREMIRDNFDGFNFLDLSLDDFKELSVIGRKFLKKGITIPLTDLLIFYHTFNNNLTIITKDKHFKLMDEMESINLRLI